MKVGFTYDQPGSRNFSLSRRILHVPFHFNWNALKFVSFSHLLLLIVLWPFCNAAAQSPSSIGGRTIQLTISSGTAPFASSGAYRFLPSATDSSYAIVPISGAISPSSGTHTYTKTGANTAQLSFTDSIAGALTANCTFTTANSGTYSTTRISFPGSSQTGTFLLYSGTSPTSIAGYTVTVSVTSGASPFASSGSYQFLPAASGNTYNIIGLSGVANSSGTYFYTQNSTLTGIISFTDSISGSGLTSQLSFDSATSGTGLLRKLGSSGYQTATFTMVPPIPSLTATSTGNNLTLLWPDSATGYRVESTLSLSQPSSWSNVPGTFQTSGGSISIVLPMTGPQKFYRLAKP